MCNKFNPNHYSYLEDDSAMIQAAVDAAKETGETVVIPRVNERTGLCLWNIERAIRLHSGSVVCLDNCILRQADDIFDNIFVNSNLDKPESFTREGRQYDIKIYGLGNALLDGGVHNGKTENTQKGEGNKSVLYNSMFNFVNTERVQIKNIRVVNQRYWAIVFHYSSNCTVSDIDFYAPQIAPNQDGIDLRTGCSHFLIENIRGCTGDDTIALTCLKSKFDDGMKEAGFDDAIHHVIIRNVMSRTPCALVRLLNHGGKLLYDIIIENVMELTESDSVQERDKEYISLHPESDKLRVGACVRIGENFYYKDGEKAKLSDTYNVTVRNIVGRMRTGIRVNCALNNAVFDNIQVFGNGGTGVYFGEGHVRNIRVSNIGYSMCHSPRPNDDNRAENHFNMGPGLLEPVTDRKVCAVYFKETLAENITFNNIHATDKLTAVFGGNGKVSMKAENVILESTDTPLFDPDLIVEKMSVFEF